MKVCVPLRSLHLVFFCVKCEAGFMYYPIISLGRRRRFHISISAAHHPLLLDDNKKREQLLKFNCGRVQGRRMVEKKTALKIKGRRGKFLGQLSCRILILCNHIQGEPNGAWPNGAPHPPFI